MVNEDSWHAVSPVGEPAYSLMITGTPWSRESPKSSYKLNTLEPMLELEILEFFRQAYKK